MGSKKCARLIFISIFLKKETQFLNIEITIKCAVVKQLCQFQLLEATLILSVWYQKQSTEKLWEKLNSP